MTITMVIMPSVGEQIRMGYELVVDPTVATVPERIPVWLGDDFKRPAIGWATNIHMDGEGRLVGDLEIDAAYGDHVIPGLNWSPAVGGAFALWGASLFPVTRGHNDA